MINGPSVYDSGVFATIRPYFKAFFDGPKPTKILLRFNLKSVFFLTDKYPSSCQNHIQPEKVEWWRRHPNHIQRDHLSFFYGRKSIFGRKLCLKDIFNTHD